jgi:hypothetical protein
MRPKRKPRWQTQWEVDRPYGHVRRLDAPAAFEQLPIDLARVNELMRKIPQVKYRAPSHWYLNARVFERIYQDEMYRCFPRA